MKTQKQILKNKRASQLKLTHRQERQCWSFLRNCQCISLSASGSILGLSSKGCSEYENPQAIINFFDINWMPIWAVSCKCEIRHWTIITGAQDRLAHCTLLIQHSIVTFKVSGNITRQLLFLTELHPLLYVVTNAGNKNIRWRPWYFLKINSLFKCDYNLVLWSYTTSFWTILGETS